MTDARVLDRRQVFDGRLLNVAVESVRLPNGRVRTIEIVRHPGGAAALPIDADGNVVMVRQYRHPVGQWLLEIPAGKLDGGEPPEVCARRELEEETGYKPVQLLELGSVVTAPGFSDERIWLFLATGLQTGRQDLESGEVIRVERIPFEEALRMARLGEIRDAKTVCALLLAEGRIRGQRSGQDGVDATEGEPSP